MAIPATAGWYEIESLHDNPDNIDFVALIQADPETALSVRGKFHDSGAIVLKEAVRGIKPIGPAELHNSIIASLRGG